MKNFNLVRNGFTLVELMVTLSMVAILMVVALPSFTSYQRNAELTSFSNTLLAGINAARSEAMKRGRNSMVVPTDGTYWSSGWIVFVDVNRSGAYEVANDITVLTSGPAPSYLDVTNIGATTEANLYLMYDASGYSKLKTSAFGAWTFEIKRNDVTGSELLSHTRRIKIASTGRARVCTPQTSTDMNCLATTAY